MTVEELIDALRRLDAADATVVFMEEDGRDYSVVQAVTHRPAGIFDPYPFPRVELWP